MNPFDPLLDAKGHVVLDGGLATALEARGLDLDSRLWASRLLLERPEEIRGVHTAYLEAGADCITTACYQATVQGFRAAGLGESDAHRALLRSSELALEARARAGASDALVAASIGPYGAFLADGSEYDGRYGVEEGVLDTFHRDRFSLLAGSGVDLMACETIPSALEAEVLLQILDDHPGVWAWLSFTCPDGDSISDGSAFIDVVSACAAHDRVAAVGVNCSSLKHVVSLISLARTVTDLPLIAYPNSGEQYHAEDGTWSGAAEAERGWVQGMRAVRAAGAMITGGCCRIGPDIIRELRDDVERGDSA